MDYDTVSSSSYLGLRMGLSLSDVGSTASLSKAGRNVNLRKSCHSVLQSHQSGLNTLSRNDHEENEESVSIHQISKHSSDALVEDVQKTGEPQFTFGKWVVYFCAVCNFALGISLPVAMSAMFLDWQEAFQVSRAHTAAVHSTAVGIVFGGAIIPGYLTNRFGPRFTVLVGSLLACMGCLASSFATSINFLIVTTGVFGGLGFSFIHLPSMPAILLAIQKYRSIAVSLCTCGSAMCNMSFPYLYRLLIDIFGWRGTFIFISGFCLQTAVFGLIMTSHVKNPSYHPRHTTEHEVEELEHSLLQQKDNYDGIPEKDNYDGIPGKDNYDGIPEKDNYDGIPEKDNYDGIPQKDNYDGIPEKDNYDGIPEKDNYDGIPEKNNYDGIPQKDNRDQSENQASSDEQTFCLSSAFELSENKRQSVTYSNNFQRMKCRIHRLKNSEWRFLFDFMYILVTIHICICLASVLSFVLVIMDFARTKGFDEDSGVFFLFLIFITSLIGRFLSGFVNLIPYMHSIIIMGISGIVSSCAVMVLGSATDYSTIVAILVLLGFGVGGVVAVYTKCVLDIDSVDLTNYPLALGLSGTSEGGFDILLPVLIGYSVDRSGSYALIFHLLGGISLITSIILVVVKILFSYKTYRISKAKPEEGQ